jgi:hypothetical protein
VHNLELIKNIGLESERSKQRVEIGELPFQSSDPAVLDSVKLLLVIEEIGEVAECCKVLEGYKPRLRWTEALAKTRLRRELMQVASITLLWIESLEDDDES